MERLCPSPPFDTGMIAATHHIGHRPAPELGGTGVVRLFEQPGRAETFVHRARHVAHRPRQQPHDRFDDQARGHFSPVEHDIADAEFAVDEMFVHSVVDALVATAQQREAVAYGQFLSHPLVEASPAGPEQVQRPGRLRRFYGREQRFRFHHHARPAAEWRIVDGPVNVGGLITRIVQAKVEQASAACLAQQALGAELIDEARKDGEHVDAHDLQAYGTMIYHLTEPARWQQSLAEGVHTGSSRGVELADEGYIHASTAAQWAATRERFYGDLPEVLLLHIDESLLGDSVVVYEQLGEASEPFPHIYGPVPLAAVEKVEPLSR
jgi:uncharacterized protein (DUF952 family)